MGNVGTSNVTKVETETTTHGTPCATPGSEKPPKKKDPSAASQQTATVSVSRSVSQWLVVDGRMM